MAWSCRRCGHSNPEGGKFCLGCGADLECPPSEGAPRGLEASTSSTDRAWSLALSTVIALVAALAWPWIATLALGAPPDRGAGFVVTLVIGGVALLSLGGAVWFGGLLVRDAVGQTTGWLVESLILFVPSGLVLPLAGQIMLIWRAIGLWRGRIGKLHRGYYQPDPSLGTVSGAAFDPSLGRPLALTFTALALLWPGIVASFIILQIVYSSE